MPLVSILDSIVGPAIQIRTFSRLSSDQPSVYEASSGGHARDHWNLGTISSSRIPSCCQRHGIVMVMDTTIVAAGRVVIPKILREALGLSVGTRIRIEQRDEVLVLSHAEDAGRWEPSESRLVLTAPAGTPPLTAEAVRDLVERVRRSSRRVRPLPIPRLWLRSCQGGMSITRSLCKRPDRSTSFPRMCWWKLRQF